MTPEKRQKLEAAGWQVGTATEFLDLLPEEEAEIERRVNENEAAEPGDSASRRTLEQF